MTTTPVDANPMLARVNSALARRNQEGLWRSRNIREQAAGPEVTIQGRRLLCFDSNDYLGLASHSMVREAMHRGIDQYGVGAGSADLIRGHTSAHARLEERVAQFLGHERALLFSSGYQANLGILSALLQRGDVVVQDRLNHASLIDGARLSGARLRRYRHLDINHAARHLSKAPGARLLVTDGVFSMDGDRAPLQELAAICRTQDAWLVVDDAHGFGVIGDQGRGSCSAAGLHSNEVQIHMVTLGKALGCYGACVAGERDLIEYLVQFSRNYIYTTALPPALAVAAIAALEIVIDEPQRRERLHALAQRLHSGLESLGLATASEAAAIQPLVVGDSEKANRLSSQLYEEGILVAAVRPPTVPQGEARLRLTLTADHTAAQVDHLLSLLDHHARF